MHKFKEFKNVYILREIISLNSAKLYIEYNIKFMLKMPRRWYFMLTRLFALLTSSSLCLVVALCTYRSDNSRCSTLRARLSNYVATLEYNTSPFCISPLFKHLPLKNAFILMIFIFYNKVYPPLLCTYFFHHLSFKIDQSNTPLERELLAEVDNPQAGCVLFELSIRMTADKFTVSN